MIILIKLKIPKLLFQVVHKLLYQATLSEIPNLAKLKITPHSLIWMVSWHLLTRVSDFPSPCAMWKVYYVNLMLPRPDHLLMVVSSPAVVLTESRVVIGLTESPSTPWAKVAVLESSIGPLFSMRRVPYIFGLALAGCRSMLPKYSRIKGFVSLTVTYPTKVVDLPKLAIRGLDQEFHDGGDSAGMFLMENLAPEVWNWSP